MKPPVYGKNTFVEFYDSVAGTPVGVFEVQSFSWQFDDEIKSNRALGESGRGTTQYLESGGSFSIDGKHTDPALVAFAIKQSAQVKGSGNSKGKSGKQPYIIVRQEITYNDGSVLILTFDGVVLYNLNNGAGEAHEELTQSIQGSFENVSMESSSTGTAAEYEDGVTMHNNAISNIVNMVSSQLGLEEFVSGDSLVSTDLSQRILP